MCTRSMQTYRFQLQTIWPELSDQPGAVAIGASRIDAIDFRIRMKFAASNSRRNGLAVDGFEETPDRASDGREFRNQ